MVGSALTSAGISTASVTVPFQIDPAPFGNPNGSFDAPAVRCVAVIGESSGAVTITGGKEDRWGCLLSSDVRWLNLSTGEAGFARTSDGLHGLPSEANLATGSGQVVVTVTSPVGVITPGVATFQVP
ncbi:hypothetical protein [Rhodococcoides kyotonense]|nr:hypothetical protein [Rhodococcus kyotonensis]